MAEIVQLHDRITGKKSYPVTAFDAVLDTDGTHLSEKFDLAELTVSEVSDILGIQ